MAIPTSGAPLHHTSQLNTKHPTSFEVFIERILLSRLGLYQLFFRNFHDSAAAAGTITAARHFILCQPRNDRHQTIIPPVGNPIIVTCVIIPEQIDTKWHAER